MKYLFLITFFVFAETNAFSEKNSIAPEICQPGYITPEDGPHCSYEQKSRSTALTLAVLLGWTGAPGYYIENNGLGIISTVMSSVSLASLIALNRFAPRNIAYDFLLNFTAAAAITIPWGIMIGYVSGGNVYDGNGYALTNSGGLDLGVFFEDLIDSTTVPVTFPIRFGVQGIDLITQTTDIFCLLIDQAAKYIPIGKQIPKGTNTILYLPGQTTGTLTLEPGSHTLTLQLVDQVGRSYGQKFSRTINVVVQSS